MLISPRVDSIFPTPNYTVGILIQCYFRFYIQPKCAKKISLAAKHLHIQPELLIQDKMFHLLLFTPNSDLAFYRRIGSSNRESFFQFFADYFCLDHFN